MSNTGEPLPKLGEASHYYAARETDASPLRSGQETEKLLFYRGIADFGVDVKPLVRTDSVLIRKDGTETIPWAIVFENHAGHAAYHVIRRLAGPVSVKLSDLGGTTENLRSEFEDELIEMGLYRKEAHAMIQTWGDSWFEEGLRVFYILPRAKVDALLPVFHSTCTGATRSSLCRPSGTALAAVRQGDQPCFAERRCPGIEEVRPFFECFPATDEQRPGRPSDVRTSAPVPSKILQRSCGGVIEDFMYPVARGMGLNCFGENVFVLPVAYH